MRLSKARKDIVTAMMKDSIFEAAVSVFEQHGVGGMTMERVAATAGLAAGSLYNYFRSKNDLLQFVYARLVEPYVEALEAIVESRTPAPQKLEEILRSTLKRSTQQKGLIALMAESDQQCQMKRQVRPRVLQLLGQVFQQGINEGSFRSHEPAHTSRMFHGCLSELFEMQAEGASGDEVNEYVDVLIDAVRHGFSIYPEKDTSSQSG